MAEAYVPSERLTSSVKVACLPVAQCHLTPDPGTASD